MWNGRLKRHYRTTRLLASASMSVQVSWLDACVSVPLFSRKEGRMPPSGIWEGEPHDQLATEQNFLAG